MTTEQNVYSSDLKVKSRRINRFDLLLVFFVSLALWGLAQNSQQMAAPYAIGQPIEQLL